MKTLNNALKIKLICLGLFYILASSCEQNDFASVALISTSEVEILSFNSVKCGGDVSSDGNASIIERGICWGTNQNPTIEDNKIVHESGETGSFTLNLTGLSNNVSFYIRAYATNKAGTAYGQEVSFILWLNEPDMPVNDVDNNEYSTVKIGEQVWMRENLRAVHYRNGDPVPNISILQDEMWLAANSGAYCNYDDNPDNAAIYGHLYNWYAVNDNRNICPVGWRIPNREDWQELIDYLGGSLEAQQKLIATNLPEFYWTVPDLVLSNYISGFSALPGGIRSSRLVEPENSFYFGLGQAAYWWTSEGFESSGLELAYYSTTQPNFSLLSDNATKITGLNIRCIKEQE